VGKFFVQNFGCRATQADGAALEAMLADKGLESSAERRVSVGDVSGPEQPPSAHSDANDQPIQIRMFMLSLPQ